MASEGAAPLRKALALGRWELCRMKSFQPGYFGSSPLPGEAGGGDQLGRPRVGGAPHGGALEPGVRAEAGVVEVPLVPGGGAGEALHAGGVRVGVDLDGLVEVPQVEDRELAGAVVTGGVGVGAVGLLHAGDGVGARRAGRAAGHPRLRRVGHVHDHQLATTRVGVLDVAGRCLEEVDADQREAADLAVGVGALPAVHRLVLELQRREYAGQRRPGRGGHVVDPDRVQVGLHEQRLGLHEAPGDAGRGRVARGQRDVVAGDQRDVLVGAEQLALLRDPVAVVVRLRRRAGQDGAGEKGDRRGGRQDAHDRPTIRRARSYPAAGCRRRRVGQLWASEASRAAWSTDSVATAASASFSCWSLNTRSFEVCDALTEGAILSCQAVYYPRVGADRVAEKRLGHACPFQGARGRTLRAVYKSLTRAGHASSGARDTPPSADPSQKCTQNPASRHRSAG